MKSNMFMKLEQPERQKPPNKTKTIHVRMTEELNKNLNLFATERRKTLSRITENALSNFIDKELSLDSTFEIFNMYPKEVKAQILTSELKLPESLRMYTYAYATKMKQTNIKATQPEQEPLKPLNIHFRVTEEMFNDLNLFATEKGITLSKLISDILSQYINRQINNDSIFELFNLYPKEIQEEIIACESVLSETERWYTNAYVAKMKQEDNE